MSDVGSVERITGDTASCFTGLTLRQVCVIERQLLGLPISDQTLEWGDKHLLTMTFGFRWGTVALSRFEA